MDPELLLQLGCLSGAVNNDRNEASKEGVIERIITREARQPLNENHFLEIHRKCR